MVFCQDIFFNPEKVIFHDGYRVENEIEAKTNIEPESLVLMFAQPWIYSSSTGKIAPLIIRRKL